MELEEIIEMIDIVEYISQFVELEEKNGEWWGLSPFKDENTPSFSVRKETNNFYDFSSGIGGNVFTFTKYYNKCSSREEQNSQQPYPAKNFRPLKQHKKYQQQQSTPKTIWNDMRSITTNFRHGN